MENLTRLFKLMELTRSMPQYGYVAGGLHKQELSDLAQHHYLVTFFAWQLARQANKAGGHLNVEKVMEYCLVHDLGELFGGDISMIYARVNKKAKKLSREFEYQNVKFLSKFFGADDKHFKQLALEVNNFASDESKVAMIADIMEATHYKLYVNLHRKIDMVVAKEKIGKHLGRIKDKVAKTTLESFVSHWFKTLPVHNDPDEIISLN